MESSQSNCELFSYEDISPQRHQLYKELEKRIYLGQWELARGCVFTILSTPDPEFKTLIQILKKVVLTPHISSIRSPVSSLTHLSWLASRFLQSISQSQSDIDNLRKKAEFQVMLHDILPNEDQSVLEELSKKHSEVFHDEDGLSDNCCTVLRKAFLQNPDIVSCLLDKLITSNNTPNRTNVQVKTIYLQSVLHRIKQVGQFLNISLSTPQRKRQCLQKVQKVLYVLNLLPELTDDEVELDELRKLLYNLVEMCTANIINITDIYSSLLARKSPDLLQLFCNEEDKFFSRNDDLYQLSSSNITVSKDFLQETFLRCIKQQTHFLDSILKSTSQLLTDGNGEEAWTSLENSLMRKLQPFIVILSWQSCTSDESANYILDIIKSWKPTEFIDPLLSEIFKKLQYNLHIVDWCINKLRSLFPHCTKSEFLHKRRNIFNQLLSQSPLGVLHKMIGLRNINHSDVLSLLKYCQAEGEISNEENVDNLLLLSNSMVFHGYLTIMHVMDAIGASCELEQLSSMKTNDEKSSNIWCNNSIPCDEEDVAKDRTIDSSKDIQSKKDSSIQQIPVNGESIKEFVTRYGCQAAYSHFVMDRLKKAKSELSQIFPVLFRVEILENIFSLLFVTSYDFQENNENYSDSDNEDVEERQAFDFSRNIDSKQNEEISKEKISSNFNRKSGSDNSGFYQFKSVNFRKNNTTCRISKSGFLCNEFITRDLLAILKDAHTDANSAKYRWLSKKSFDNKKENNVEHKESTADYSSLVSFIKTSVTESTLQERMSRLQKYISEAQWRFELVASDLVPQDVGIFKILNKETGQLKKYGIRKQSKSSDRENEHLSSSSGREEAKMKRKRRQSMQYRLHGISGISEPGFIYCMLASPSDLLCHSLWKKNYDQAKQVIQLFSLHDDYDASEVYFAESYSTVVKKIESLSEHNGKLIISRHSLDETLNINKPSSSSNVSALAEAAAAGVESTTVTSLIDEMLSSVPFPTIPNFLKLTENQQFRSVVKEFKELQSIVIADCAFTVNTTLDTKRLLFQTAIKRLKFLSTDNNETEMKKKCTFTPKGIVKTTEAFESLLQEIENTQQLKQNYFPSFFLPEINFSNSYAILLGSFDYKLYKEQIHMWKNFMDKVNCLEKLLKMDNGEKRTEANITLDPKNQLHITFQKLSKICSLQLRYLMTESMFSQGHKYINFLKVLYDHISHVSRALEECKISNQSAGCSVYTSYFSVLNESPNDILSKMMLQNGISPTKLEKFAVQMKVNLVHILTQNCFPYVPTSYPNYSSSTYPVTSNTPYIILNASNNVWHSVRHPELAAREILSDILGIIQDACLCSNSLGILTIPIAISLLKEQGLKQWMMTTEEIAYVDLSLLQSKEEKLAFFGNLCNIMWIHAIFSEIDVIMHSKNMDIIHALQSNRIDTLHSENHNLCHIQMLSSNLIERLLQQKIYGYNIGNLYTVSLLDLRYHILRADLPLPSHVSAPPISYLFDDFEQNIFDFGVEPRLLFTVCEGFTSSPKLQVLYPETVFQQLDNAVRDFINFHVEVDAWKEVVVLPELLYWYSQDFKDNNSDLYQTAYEPLLNFISAYCEADLKDNLHLLLDFDSSSAGLQDFLDESGKEVVPFSVKIKPFSFSFGIILDYNNSVKKLTEREKITAVEKLDYQIISQQTYIAEYLKTKCQILSNFLMIMNYMNNNESETSEELTSSRNPFALKLIQDTPLLRLFKYAYEWWKKYSQENIIDDNSSWFSSVLNPQYYKNFVWNYLSTCLKKEDWQTALYHLSVLENTSYSIECDLLKDIVLFHLASLNLKDIYPSSWSCALQIKNVKRKVNCILSCLKSWPADVCLKILRACLTDEKIINEVDLHNQLRRKFREISLYQKIVEIAAKSTKLSQPSFTNWQEVEELSVIRPIVVLNCIKNSEYYQLSVEWAELHSVPKEIKQLVIEMHVSWLLNQSPPQLIEAEQILDSLDDFDMHLFVSNAFLKSTICYENKLFFIEYILNNSELQKEESNARTLKQLLISFKMMVTINEKQRNQYEHLLHHPHLLLEQLLMNMQIEAVEKAIKLILDLCKIDYNNELLSVDKIDKLLEVYAAKALEIPVVDVYVSSSSSSSDASSQSGTSLHSERFSMPLNVPRKEEWVPDEQVRKCMVCQNEKFSMFNRRHHCRRCGRVICNTCSEHRMTVEGYGSVPVRICDECYEQISGNAGDQSLEQRLKHHVSGTLPSPKQYDMHYKESSARRKSSIIASPELQWLTDNENHNNNIREEFYYEQAPSVSLCLSILKLHSNVEKCSYYVLHLCDNLFNMLIPKTSDLPNPEIDYGLIISMIHSLLLNIKVKFSEAGISDGVEYVDTYISFLDLMKQLVNDNCVHLLPKDSITSIDAIRKLRDALRDDERMTLALEISTKYSRDPFGIWATWGKTYLQIGDWMAAREKFSHCLKKPKNSNQPKNENALLKDIINILENSKTCTVNKTSTILKSLSTLKNIQSGITSTAVLKNEKYESQVLKECLYYLENYGCHFSFVSFYQRHNMLSEAVSYIIREQCDSDVFIEGLFLPCVKCGMITVLKNIISNQNLKKFGNYLTATCRYLERNQFYHLLYDLQLYMKDYIRAAMTNIMFFQEYSECYSDIKNRLHYLHDANKHLKTYLKTQSEIKEQVETADRQSLHLLLSTDKVKKHLRTIELQIDLTKCFCDWESENKLLYSLKIESVKDGNEVLFIDLPPTLLGDSVSKIYVSAMAIINSPDIENGVITASIIVREFSLNWLEVLNLAGSSLISHNLWNKMINLIEYINKHRIVTIFEIDEIILCYISIAGKLFVENNLIENLIKLLSDDIKKINAYITCTKLKKAYLLAVKHRRASDVQKIMVVAEQDGKEPVRRLCEQWLNSKSQNSQK